MQQEAGVVVEIHRPAPEVDPIRQFINKFIATYNITSHFKWNTDHRNTLEQAALNAIPPINILSDMLRKQIMTVVNSAAVTAPLQIDVSAGT